MFVTYFLKKKAYVCNLFSEKKKKKTNIINLSSAAFAKRVANVRVLVTTVADSTLKYFSFHFPEQIRQHFM